MCDVFIPDFFHSRAVDPNDLLDAIQDAELAGDDGKVEKLLCGAVKYLKMNRAKPNEAMVLTLMFLAKTKNQIFGSEVVIEVRFYMLIHSHSW